MAHLVTKGDIPRIIAAFISDSETGSFKTGAEEDGFNVPFTFKKEWPFIFLVTIDLGVDLCTIQNLKEGLRTSAISDIEALTEILQGWVSLNQGKYSTWSRLISVFSENLQTFGDLTNKDYVTLLKSLSQPLINIQTENLKLFEKILRIDLIWKEIYGGLNIKDRQAFRLTSRLFHELSLKDYRKSTKLVIYPTRSNFGLSLKTFHNLFKKTEGEYSEETYQLMQVPYENCVFHGERILPPSKHFQKPNEDPDAGWRDCDIFFWSRYAPFLTQLTFHGCSFDGKNFLQSFNWLLEACPLLEGLTFRQCRTTEVEQHALGPSNEPKVFNLKSLQFLNNDFTNVPDSGVENLLKVVPEVQDLRIENLRYLVGLMNTEGLKLSSLKLSNPPVSFNYFERFTERYPTLISNLRLKISNRAGLREVPSTFYHGLQNCSGTLTSLHLELSNVREFVFPETPYSTWLIELTTLNFPQLKSLKITFKDDICREHPWKFDFRALQSMPKLKCLSVINKNFAVNPQDDFNVLRNGEDEDWIYKGVYNDFLPPDVRRPRVAGPICMESLEEFNFNAWGLTFGDLDLFSVWFPRLKRFSSAFNERALAALAMNLEPFRELERFTLIHRGRGAQARDGISEALKKLKNVRIFLEDVPALGKMEAKIDKTDNERVYFKLVK